MKIPVFPTKLKLFFVASGGVVIFVSFLMLIVLAGSVPGANAATITVSNLNDSGTGSLRRAVTDAMATNAEDDINFSVSGTIVLSSALPDIIPAGGNLTIDGAGQSVAISGNNNVRVFWVEKGASLTLQDLTVANGYSTGEGGGIYNAGTVTVNNTTFSHNSSDNFGGAISNFSGTLTIANSTFSGNSATRGGGFTSAGPDNTVSLTNCTFFNNSATAPQTSSPGGGAIAIGTGTLTISNSTISGNNVNTYGGGIYSYQSTTTLINTIVSDNTPDNCSHSGAFTNGGHNIDSGTTCGWASENGSMSNTDPRLGPLADNGGPTQTMPLLQGSPAIDEADPNNFPSTDQRGISRPQGAGSDIGAYEYVSVAQTLPVSLALNKSSYTVGDPLNVDVTFANPGNQLLIDVYFAILLPASSGPSFGCPLGDAVLFFSNGMTSASVACASDPIQSFPRTFEGVAVPTGLPSSTLKNFLSLVLPQGVPAGEYQIFMVLTQANALLDGTVDPGDVVGVAAATMSFSP